MTQSSIAQIPVAVVSDVSVISGVWQWCIVAASPMAASTPGTNWSTPAMGGDVIPSAPPVETAKSTLATTSVVNTVRQESTSLVSRNRQYRAFTCRIASSSSATVVSAPIVYASSSLMHSAFSSGGNQYCNVFGIDG